MKIKKIKTMKRIKEEYNELNQHPSPNIGASVGLVDEDNIFEWRCTLIGPKGTSYEKGLFTLKIKFPDPTKAPEFAFKTPIYHLNVNPYKSDVEGSDCLGHVNINTINNWNPEKRVKDILNDIFVLLCKPNPDSPYGLERGDEFKMDRPVYEYKAKCFTKKYANPLVKYDDEYITDWDFTTIGL